MTLDEGIERARDRGDFQMLRWLTDLKEVISYEDLTIPVPCTYYVNSNTQAKQMSHIMQEVAEVYDALLEDRIGHAAEELTDVITACTTMLEMLGYTKERRAVLQAKVNEKNRKRGYWSND